MKLELICTDVNKYIITSSSGAFEIRGTKTYAEKLMAEMQKVVDAMQNVTPANRQTVIEGLAGFY